MTTAAELRSPTALTYRFSPRSRQSVWLARELVGQWLREHDVTGSDLDDLLVACSELTTNAVAHSGTGSTVTLRAGRSGNDVWLQVEDVPGKTPYDDPEPSDGAPGGDLRVAAALTDGVTLTVTGGVTVVRATKRLGR